MKRTTRQVTRELNKKFEARQKVMYSRSAVLSSSDDESSDDSSAEEKQKTLDQQTQQLLKHVVDGEQNKAETLIKDSDRQGFFRSFNKLLILQRKGTVTDLSGRTFEQATAFQCAIWALDWHMWVMLMKYMSVQDAAEQLKDYDFNGLLVKYEDGRICHKTGGDFILMAAIAIRTYLDNYSRKYEGASTPYWYEKVGGLQRLLPAHAINEYCRQDRGFFPLPSFKERNLPRTRTLKNDDCKDDKDWFTTRSDDNILGKTFAVVRFRSDARPIVHKLDRRYNTDWMTTRLSGTSINPRYDANALVHLFSVRSQQLNELREKLLTKPRIFSFDILRGILPD